MRKDANNIEITNLSSKINHMIVTIEGDSDLVLNKMNARNARFLKGDRNKLREEPNPWEDLITAIHWRDRIDENNLYKKADEAMMHKLLAENAPCITQFGLKKSFGQTVVRTGIDKYATSFDAAMNITCIGGLIPIKFGGWAYSEQLMSPKRGAPVNVLLNHFMGWKATFQVDYMEGVYSRDRIVDVINLAGFSLGIGSGRTSGYGRYHVSGVELEKKA